MARLKEINTYADKMAQELSGFFTFDEFKRNRNKYVRNNTALDTVANGSQEMHTQITRYVYEIGHYKCRTLEEVERVASDMGYDIHSMKFRAELIPGFNFKGEIKVRFLTPEQYNGRNNW